MFGKHRDKPSEEKRRPRREELFSYAEQYDQRGGFNNQNFYGEEFSPVWIYEGDLPETPDNLPSREGGAGRRFSSDYSREAIEGVSHVGKGPKGYVRTDTRIHEEICESLTHDSRLDASEIEVDVRDGEVTLTGQVARREDRWRAEEIAAECFGVRDVRNELQIDRKEEPSWNDRWTRELRETRFPLYPFD